MKFRIYIRVLFALLITASPLGADTIVLRDGGTISGKIVEENNEAVTLDVPGGSIRIARDRIARIERESQEDYSLKQAERLMKLGAFEAAGKYYKIALEKKPDDKELEKKLTVCYAALAKQYFERRNLKRAEATYKKLARYDSKSAQAGLAAVKEILINATNREKAADAFYEIEQYDQALSQYEKVLEDVPHLRTRLYTKMATCHVQLGDASMSLKDFLLAEQEYDKALEYDPRLLQFLEPRWTAAKAMRIQMLLKKQRYKQARDACRAALSIVPDSHAMRFLLGEAYLGLDLESLAREAYRKAAPGYIITPSTKMRDLRAEALKRLLPPEKAAKRADEEKRWKEVLPGGTRKLATVHFIIHHRNDYVAKRIAESAELQYKRIVATLDYLGKMKPWKEKCPIHVYPTQKEYKKKSGLPAWSGGVARHKHAQGKLLEQDIICYQAAGNLLGCVIPHELCHLVLARLAGYNTRIPMWADEGLAISFENKMKKAYYRRYLGGELKRKNHFSLEALLKIKAYPDEDRTALFYAQSGIFVQYLLDKGGYPKFMEMLELIKGGSGSADALKKIYKVDNLLKLEAGYLEAVRK